MAIFRRRTPKTSQPHAQLEGNEIPSWCRLGQPLPACLLSNPRSILEAWPENPESAQGTPASFLFSAMSQSEIHRERVHRFVRTALGVVFKEGEKYDKTLAE